MINVNIFKEAISKNALEIKFNSLPEQRMYGYLRLFFPNEVIFVNKNWSFANNKQVDLYMPSLNLAVEVQGPFHYSNINESHDLFAQIVRDEEKKQAIEKSGIKFLSIYDSELKVMNYLHILKRLLLAKNIYDTSKIKLINDIGQFISKDEKISYKNESNDIIVVSNFHLISQNNNDINLKELSKIFSRLIFDSKTIINTNIQKTKNIYISRSTNEIYFHISLLVEWIFSGFENIEMRYTN